MGKTRLALLAVLAAAGLAGFASAATYYVSPSGDDKNTGVSPDKAWATLERSCPALRAGDTLIVREGRYRERKSFAIEGLPGKDEDLSKPVVIRAERPHTAIVQGDIPIAGFSKVPGLRFVYRCDMKGPLLAVLESDTDIVYQPVASPHDADEVVASYCLDPAAQALYVHTTDGNPPDMHALWGSVSAYGGHYRTSLTGEGPGRAVIIDGLVFKGFQSMALDLRYARNLTVRNCVFYHNMYGLYISNFARNVRAENNLLFSNNMPRSGSPEQAAIVVGGDMGDIVIEGNVARYNRFNNIRLYGGTIAEGKAVTFSNNRCYGESPFWFKPNIPGGVMTGNVAEAASRAWTASRNTFAALMEPPHDGEDNLVFGQTESSRAAAKFVDPISGDYRLQSDSPFRKKGKDGGDLGAFPYKGDVFFVKPDGNDAAEGTSTSLAWKTLSRAVERLRPGDTLYVMAGTYADSVHIVQKATADRPIAIRRRGHDRALLRAPHGPGGGVITIQDAEHVSIEGLEVSCADEGAGIVAVRSANIAVRECLFHDNHTDGIVLRDCGPVSLHNNTFVRNGVHLNATGARGELEAIGNIFQNSRLPLVDLDEVSAKQYYGNYNCLRQALREGPDSIQTDAMFARAHESMADPEKDDFRLKVGSPCRGRGQFERTIGRNDLVPVVPAELEVEDVRVHYVGGTNATITYWTPKKPSYSVVEYGTGEEKLGTVHVRLGQRIFHAVSLTDLKPNTRYWFRPGARYHSESWIDYTRRAWGQAGRPAPDAEGFSERKTFTTLAADPAGRTLYVRQDGDDTRDGLTAATAWRTMRRAAAEAHAGDTVLVGPGRYYETIVPLNSGVNDRLRITFRAEDPRAAVLDGKDFSLPYAFKAVGKNYLTLDGFRIEYQNANDYDMTGVGPWSAQVLLSDSKFCTVRNCYFSGAPPFPQNRWTALMGIRIDNAEGALVDDNFFFFNTWSVWTTTDSKAGPEYVLPFFRNNTFFVQHIWAFHVTGDNDRLKLRNNLFGEYVRAKWGHRYLSIWFPWACRLDSDYNFFWWYNDKPGKPEHCSVGSWHKGPGQRIEQVPGGLAEWQKLTGQDMHSLEAFFPTNNLYDQLDFTVEGKPYKGKGENGADIGCTWIGKHTDQVVFGDPKSKVDVPPWQK